MLANRSHPWKVARLWAVGAAALLLLASCSNSDGGSDDGAAPSTDESGEVIDAEVEVGDGPHGEFEEITDVPGVTDDEIHIALLSTGDANPVGYCLLQCQADGIQAYFDWRNSQGGIHGRDLVLDVIDDELGNNKTLALEIIDNGEHFAVIGSPIIADGFPDLADAGFPVYASAVQSDIADGVENIFTPFGTTCILCPSQRTVWPAVDAGVDTVGVLGLNAAQASRDCVTGIGAAFERWGDDLGISVGFSSDGLPFGLTNGVAPEVTAMKDAGVGLVITCMDQNSVLVLEEEMERQGMGDVPVVLPNAYGDADYLSANAELLEGDYIGVSYRPLEADPSGTDLEQLIEYMGANDAAINDWAIISWINADMLFRGILAAGPQFSQQAVIDTTNSFTAIDAGGIIAPVDWTRQHDAVTPDDLVTNAPGEECFAYVRVEGGEAVLQGSAEEPHFCWEPGAETYEDPVPTSFAG